MFSGSCFYNPEREIRNTPGFLKLAILIPGILDFYTGNFREILGISKKSLVFGLFSGFFYSAIFWSTNLNFVTREFIWFMVITLKSDIDIIYTGSEQWDH